MTVLVVDDDPALRFTLREILEAEGLDVAEAADGVAALAELAARPCDLVVTDLRMPRLDGLGLLRRMREDGRTTRVILITAHGNERQAVEAMKAGAFDYFRKPFEVDELLAVVRRGLETARLAAENERLEGERMLAGSLVFASPAMSRLAVTLKRVAARDVTVLLLGESGTGKERVAEALVAASARAAQPFIRFNCASLSPELAESELFGHTKGAFTGAVRPRPGLFREAHRGTLFLDEIGELDAGAQARLLRVLQTGEVRPVGEDRPVVVDVRLVAATHRDLQEMVGRGQFREDLYYRLDVVTLRIPPLRERPEDVPVLTRHFLARAAERFGTGPLRVPPELHERLRARSWPGNVRELENTIERLVAMSPEGELDLSLLGGESGPAPMGLREKVEAYERGLLLDALRQARGNRAEAARALGLPRVTLLDKLKKYGVEGE